MTNTLDFVFVQEGTAEFILQDGVHDVAKGGAATGPRCFPA